MQTQQAPLTPPDFRILLVDDNLDAVESIADLLRHFDYQVGIATNGDQALALSAEFQPQLIISDIGLPGMDGYELAPALRAKSAGRKLILAALTGYGNASDQARAIEAGFDHHLVKPLDADSLLKFVGKQLAAY